jgi:hypothetical protein
MVATTSMSERACAETAFTRSSRVMVVVMSILSAGYDARAVQLSCASGRVERDPDGRRDSAPAAPRRRAVARFAGHDVGVALCHSSAASISGSRQSARPSTVWTGVSPSASTRQRPRSPVDADEAVQPRTHLLDLVAPLGRDAVELPLVVLGEPHDGRLGWRALASVGLQLLVRESVLFSAGKPPPALCAPRWALADCGGA